MRVIRALSTLSLVVVAGCYTWVPGGVGRIRPEEEIRADVSAAEAARIPRYLKGDTMRFLEGKVVEQGPDSLVVVVTNPAVLRGEMPGRVSVAVSAVRTVQIKRLDATRTLVFSAGAAGVVGYLLIQAVKPKAVRQGQTPSDPDQTRIPLLGIRIPFSIPFPGGR